MEEKRAAMNQSVEKTMKLVEILSESSTPMKLQDVARAAGMPASTAMRMLHTLSVLGYVDQETESLRYHLTLKFSFIGDRIARQTDVHQISHPKLAALASSAGECVCFAVRQGDDLVYLDVIAEQADNILTVTQRIGKRAPLYCTGIGKLLLSSCDPQELEAYLGRTDLVRFTERTLTDPDILKAELSQVRRQGYAFDAQECDMGACCVAAPVYNYSGKMVAGISITAPILRLPTERVRELLPAVCATAADISAALGYLQI